MGSADRARVLVDDPRAEHPKGNTLTIEHLGNSVGGEPALYLSTDISPMKRLAMESVVAGEPVWFGCDVGQQVLRKGCGPLTCLTSRASTAPS